MATLASLAGGTTVRFTRRFMGALALDAATFEDIEADGHAGGQAAVVVLLACLAGGFAAVGSSAMSLEMFVAGMGATLGAWLVWALLIAVLGTQVFAEPQTRSRPGELLRTMGFAAAPGVFLAFAAMPAVASFAVAIVSLWTIAATVLAVKRALDYGSLGRAALVCVAAWLAAFGITAAVGMLLAQPVS